MILNRPGYYREFHCIADACKDNCCKGGWQIGIDEETLAKYQSLTDDFGKRVQKAIQYTDEYCFAQEKGQCPFLDEKGLCEIYQRLGGDYMGVVCDQFPRFSEYYGDRKETGIGLACEEAARIILASDDYELTKEESTEEPYADAEWDERLSQSLYTIRTHFFAKLHKTNQVGWILKDILHTSTKVQEYINENDYEGLEVFVAEWIAKENPKESAKRDIKKENMASKADTNELVQLEEDYATLWLAYEELVILNPEWGELLEQVFNKLHPEDAKAYPLDRLKAIGDFLWENARIKRLIAYYLFRYYLKSAYHHNALGVAQFIVSSVMLIAELVAIQGEASFEHILHLMSREVEYSPDNMETLLESYLFDAIYEPENLEGFIDRVLPA